MRKTTAAKAGIRRGPVLHCTAEDVGLADPMALVLANAVLAAAEFVGWPEARIQMAGAAIYIATANKSNSAYKAIDAALADVKSGRTIPVPEHLRDASHRGAKRLGHGHGHGYEYAHDHPGHFVTQDYLGVESAKFSRAKSLFDPFQRKNLVQIDDVETG